jgi:hypothetical protein
LSSHTALPRFFNGQIGGGGFQDVLDVLDVLDELTVLWPVHLYIPFAFFGSALEWVELCGWKHGRNIICRIWRARSFWSLSVRGFFGRLGRLVAAVGAVE